MNNISSKLSNISNKSAKQELKIAFIPYYIYERKKGQKKNYFEKNI